MSDIQRSKGLGLVLSMEGYTSFLHFSNSFLLIYTLGKVIHQIVANQVINEDENTNACLKLNAAEQTGRFSLF